MVKSEGDDELTTSVTVVECVALVVVSVPVIVRVYVPTGVVLLVVTAIVEDPEPVTVIGVNVAPAPDGRPLTLKLTVSLKPFKAPTVTV